MNPCQAPLNKAPSKGERKGRTKRERERERTQVEATEQNPKQSHKGAKEQIIRYSPRGEL